MASSNHSIAPAQGGKRKMNPLLTLILSCCVFVALDAGIFRSSLYAHVASLNSGQGLMAHHLVDENARLSASRMEILLTGNSRIQQGFEPSTFRSLYKDSDLSFVKMAIPSCTLRAWYYLLDKIDPDRNKYAAIVIPLEGYKATPRLEDFDNEAEDAQNLGPHLTPAEARDFAASYSDSYGRQIAWKNILLPSHAFAPDLQDFLLHPWARLADLHARLAQAMNEDTLSSYNKMVETHFDPATDTILAFPANLDTAKKRMIEGDVKNPDPAKIDAFTDRYGAYQLRWVNRLREAYRGSRTKLIFIDVPHQPFPLVSHTPAPATVDIRDKVAAQANVYFLDPEPFQQLEQPAYFEDTRHLNHDGAIQFTKILTDGIAAIFHPPS